MAGNSYLLDTVIIVAYLNHEPTVVQQFRSITAAVSSITIGELFYGAYRSARMHENIAQIRKFTARNTILNCDVVTGDYYGQIKQQLRSKGTPIPENDIWIAAMAMQYHLPLVTRDAHFQNVVGLALVNW